MPGGAQVFATCWPQNTLYSHPLPAMALGTDPQFFFCSRGITTPWKAWVLRGKDVCKVQHWGEPSSDWFFCPLSPTSSVTRGSQIILTKEVPRTITLVLLSTKNTPVICIQHELPSSKPQTKCKEVQNVSDYEHDATSGLFKNIRYQILAKTFFSATV